MTTDGASIEGNDWSIRVPASSANLGPGFDVLGMALTLHAEIGCGDAPEGAHVADEHHPATVAFRRAGGTGPVWVMSPIPMGRGLGFSGAMRVGGAAAASVQVEGCAALDDLEVRRRILQISAELEHHADNAAASLHGGVVAVADDTVTQVPLAFDPAVVVWIPEATTSTDRSRTNLADTVNRADAVFNISRVAMFVAACASGDASALRRATEDRLHQTERLAAVPSSAAALDAGLAAGAWAAWLSGSGPTVAMLCEPSRADELAAALPRSGQTKVLRIDHAGATVTATSAPG
ncbi:MAG: homoserine kinase [Ilumatobacteraceae bacterium]